MSLIVAGGAFIAGIVVVAAAAKAAWHHGHECGYHRRGDQIGREAERLAPGPRSGDLDARWPELPEGGAWRIEQANDGLNSYVLCLTPGAAEYLKIDEKGRPSREGRPLRIEIVAPKGWPVSVQAEPGRLGLRYE